MTKSEKFVADICAMSFLPFWSFPSPVGKKGNELCDLLVVCQNIIIIFSIKDIAPSNHQDEKVVYDRWVKKAITESVSQIYGAESYISKVDKIHLKDSTHAVTLPPKGKRIVYRVAIAFGSKNQYPLPTGDFGKGYVSVFDEESTQVILKELDTITDFTNYLTAKQKFSENNTIVVPYEIDFLAIYLEAGLSFDKYKDVVLFGNNSLWAIYIRSVEYKQWKKDIEVSYIWDIMIQSFYHNNMKPDMTVEQRESLEAVFRLINLEPRINRVELGLILENAHKTKVKARMMMPLGEAEHAYLFMPLNDKNWKSKEAELGLRCIVARAEFPSAKKIIGVAIGSYSKKEITFDVHYLDMPTIDEEFVKNANSIREEFGYFKNIRQKHSSQMR